MITPKVKSESKLPKSVLNEFIQKVPSDPDRAVPLWDLDGLDDISMNISKFNSEKSKISEVSQVVKKKGEMPLSRALTKYRTGFIKNAPEV